MNNSPDSENGKRGPEDEISLIAIANTVLRNWRSVVGIPLLLAFAVGSWSITRPRLYAVAASFTPQTPDNRGVGSAAALAQQFGVNLNADRGGESPQYYVDLLRSRTLLRQAVEAEYTIAGSESESRTQNLIQHWNLEQESGGPLPPWREAVERLRRAIAVSVNRETGVVHVNVSAHEPALAEQIAERLLTQLNEFNLDVRQQRAQDETRFIGGRITDARNELIDAENALQEFLRQNRQFENSPELLFEHDRLQRHVMMRQEVYTSLLRSQEQARIDALRDIPVLTVIDQPRGAAEPQGRGTVSRVVLAFLLGLIVALGLAFVREFARRNREAGDHDYREFQGLARQAWRDLRRPTRWISRALPPAEQQRR